MYRASDLTRDQSYFLFNTTQEQLNFLRFPLGQMQKEETRKIALKLKLNVGPVREKIQSILKFLASMMAMAMMACRKKEITSLSYMEVNQKRSLLKQISLQK